MSGQMNAGCPFLQLLPMLEGQIAGCFHGVWGGGSIGALLLLAEGVTPLLLNHSRRVRLPYHALHVEPGP